MFSGFPFCFDMVFRSKFSVQRGMLPRGRRILLSLKENINVLWNLWIIKYEMRWLFGWITNVEKLLAFTQRPHKMTVLRVFQMINKLFSSFFFLILSYFLRTCGCYLLVKLYTLFFSDVPSLYIPSSSAQMDQKYFPYQFHLVNLMAPV